MAYRRVLTVQDISCVGQCSMTVALPVLSACGVEACILPTAVLSTHTGGFSNPAVHHLGDSLDAFREHWSREGISFDAILTGYLGSVQAVESTLRILEELLAPGGIVIVDPAMADHGKLYSGLDEAYVQTMTRLCQKADILLPNVTEAAMLAAMPLRENPDGAYVASLLRKLGGKTIVLTGACDTPEETGAALWDEGEIWYYTHPKTPGHYHGTGDLFASAFTGVLMQGNPLRDAVRIAADYTALCTRKTYENPAHWYGVKFETALPDLIRMLGK
ncbi:MAG: pyridoxamine kinase [Faecousia sp.]